MARPGWGWWRRPCRGGVDHGDDARGAVGDVGELAVRRDRDVSRGSCRCRGCPATAGIGTLAAICSSAWTGGPRRAVRQRDDGRARGAVRRLRLAGAPQEQVRDQADERHEHRGTRERHEPAPTAGRPQRPAEPATRRGPTPGSRWRRRTASWAPLGGAGPGHEVVAPCGDPLTGARWSGGAARPPARPGSSDAPAPDGRDRRRGTGRLVQACATPGAQRGRRARAASACRGCRFGARVAAPCGDGAAPGPRRPRLARRRGWRRRGRRRIWGVRR